MLDGKRKPNEGLAALSTREQRRKLRELTLASRTLAHHARIADVLGVLAEEAIRVSGATDALVVFRGESGVRCVRASGDPLTPPETLLNGHGDASLDAWLEEQLGGAYATVPIMDGDRERGILAVAPPQDDSDYWLLTVLADQAAAALTHAEIVEVQTQRIAAEVDRSLDGSGERPLIMSTVAHDLLSPLLTVRLGCDILDAHVGDAEDLRQVVDELRAACGRLHNVVQNLLAMGKLSAGLVEVVPGQVPIHEAVETALKALRTPKGDLERRLSVNISPSLTVWADPKHLAQVLQNLLSNALKYSTADSPVELGASAEDDHVVIRVRDFGIGIPPDQHEAIFQPYYRIAHTSNLGRPGAGLGLPVARELSRLMNGDIDLQSEPGKGAAFQVRLPRAKPAQGG